VRRWTVLLAGAALWLFLTAIPALADGGPHVSSVNSGASTLTADSCAGCHRAHTAQGAMLLKTDEEALCLTCHGGPGAGATTNVEDGVQYAADSTSGTVAGALRGGGFVNARIGSANPDRIPLSRWDSNNGVYVASFSSRVAPTLTGSSVTSAHVKLTGATLVSLQGKAWGNGALNSGAGPNVTLGCGSCHNPHGNGMYRILNPIPSTATGTLTAVAAANVAEMRLTSTVSGTRNYTVQFGGSLADVNNGTYVAGGASATAGDYWRRYQPYNTVPIRRTDFNPALTASGTPTCASNPAQNTSVTSGDAAYRNCSVYYPAGYFRGDAPEFLPAGATGATSSSAATTWRSSMTNWCSTCHTRYDTTRVASPGGPSYSNTSGDAIYMYRHPTSVECTQCHVSHGSNAAMPGDPALGTSFSTNFAYPVASGGTAVSNASSRLLKVNNRGTCQQCHDPTGTIEIPTTVYP
jgi:predicted CXXCH cytochrome family protein